MDQQREKIEADLRGVVAGAVLCDDVTLQLYASDASIYEIRPLCVVRPRGLADVVACVQYAHEHQIPVHPRGAGTGLAGESLGPGMVIDFADSMRRVVRFDEERVCVQPGVVLGQLNRQLQTYGRLFGPDPATADVTTMGSVLALDGSGSRWLKYGSARNHVESLQIVLADGSVMRVGVEQVGTESDAAATGGEDPPVKRRLVNDLAEIVVRHGETIAADPVRSKTNRCGYHLRGILDHGKLNLSDVIVGSEGTLALITEATLRTAPLPPHRGVALLMFDRLEAAAKAAEAVPALGVSACDLMDRRLLTIARESDRRYASIIPPGAEALLLVEQHGESEREVRERLGEVVDLVWKKRRLAFDSRMTVDSSDVDLYWQLARSVVPRLYRLKGSTRPLPFVEDIAVPPEEMAKFLVRVQNVLKRHNVIASVFAHAGHGQLHIRPFLDLASQENIRRMHRMSGELYEEAVRVGGTVSGEHGTGLSRTWFLRNQYGPLLNVFGEVKQLFDPKRILNPGKVTGGDATQPLRNLRSVALPKTEEATGTPVESPATNGQPQEVFDIQLAWDSAEMALAARSCNGCGECRTQMPDSRMCPIFRVAPAEEASPRAKANLVRALMTGGLDPAVAETDAVKEVADLCVNCHQCRLECPANVDIPKLMAEIKAQHVATNGLTLSDWSMTRLDMLSKVGSSLRPLSNWLLRNRVSRWVLERLLGIAQGRKLPQFSRRSFMTLARRRRLTRSTRRTGDKVVYFIDTYANYFDVQLAEAFVAVMEHNGVAVFVHPRQRSSGMPMISLGAAERASRQAIRNVTILAEAVRGGYTIVATEPTAALCLRHEYLHLLGDDDSQLVAENSFEACDFLWRRHQQGKLELDLRPVNTTVGYHLPCHSRALEVGTPAENLLRLIPGLIVQRIEKGCSGMAGTYGLKRENYRSSLRAGWGLITEMRSPRVQIGATECSSCKMQMEQGTTKPTIHPLKLLALSYGLLPEVAQLLTAHSEELTLT